MKVGDRVRHVDRAGTWLVYKSVIVTTLRPDGEADFQVTYHARNERKPDDTFQFKSFDIHRRVFIVPKKPDPAQISMWDHTIG